MACIFICLRTPLQSLGNALKCVWTQSSGMRSGTNQNLVLLYFSPYFCTRIFRNCMLKCERAHAGTASTQQLVHLPPLLHTQLRSYKRPCPTLITHIHCVSSLPLPPETLNRAGVAEEDRLDHFRSPHTAITDWAWIIDWCCKIQYPSPDTVIHQDLSKEQWLYIHGHEVYYTFCYII